MNRSLFVILYLCVVCLCSRGVEAKRGKVLVILSSQKKITLNKDQQGKTETTHETGFFLPELMVPLKKLIDKGYEPVFASPLGTKPVLDKVSDNAMWFADKEDYQQHRTLCVSLGICGEDRIGSNSTVKLSEIRKAGLDSFVAVFLPGGHAPMEDLYKDSDLKHILKDFHEKAKPTGLICHAPIALLSTLDDPQEYAKSLEKYNELQTNPTKNAKALSLLEAEIRKLSKDWIYRGYRMTVFSTKEEKAEEPGANNMLGGFVKFYPDEALDFAGAQVIVRAQKWKSHAVRDRELITGQNPSSDKTFGDLLLEAIEQNQPKVL